MKIMVTSDWELTEERLPIAEKVIDAMLAEFESGGYTHFVFCGDMFREFTAATEKFARERVERFGQLTAANGSSSGPGELLVGNHDRETSENRIKALFGHAIDVPMHCYFTSGGAGMVPVAFLPAPDRAAFGAVRGVEGKRARDAALSDALEAALISLETQIGPENLPKAILFFHGATDGSSTPNKKGVGALTWHLPAARLARWGLAIGGHFHVPQQIGDNIYHVGGIFAQTHGEKADTFRVLSIEIPGPLSRDMDCFATQSIPLPRVLVPIEVELGHFENPSGIQFKGGTCIKAGEWLRGAMNPDGALNLPATLVEYLKEGANLDPATDTVNLKIRAKLPPNELDMLPPAEALKAALNKHFGRTLVQTLSICREPQGLHKARIEGDARNMNAAEQFDAWLTTLDAVHDAAIIDKAKAFMADIGADSLLSDGKFGYKPLWLRVRNFCQWEDAYIDYSQLEGSVSVSGMNKLGKSNLFIKGPLFALYKRTSTAGAVTLDADLRLGETAGFVEHCYEASGKMYLVRRAMERGKGGVTCKSELFEVFANPFDERKEKRPVCEKATDIDRHIEDTVGSRPFFLSTVVGTQGDAGRIINATPADWGNWFIEALGLERFEPYRKDSQRKADAARDETVKVEERIDELTGQITCEEEELGDLPGVAKIEMDRIDNSEAITDARDLKATHEEKVQDLQVQIKSLNEKLESGATLETEIKDVNEQLAGIAIENIGERPARGAFEGSVDEAKGKLDRLTATRGTLDDELQKMRTRHAELGGNINSAAAELARLKTKAEQLTGRVADLENKPHGTVPCLDFERVEGVVSRTDIRDSCPAWRAYSQGDHIERLKIERGEVEAKVENVGKNLVTMKEQKATVSASVMVRKGALNAMAEEIAELSKRIGDYENAAKAIELWESKAKGIDAQYVRMAELQKKRAEIQKKLNGISGLVDDREALGMELAELRPKIAQVVTDIEGHEIAIRMLNRQLDQIKAIREAIEKKRAKVKEYRGSIADKLVTGQAWGLLALAFHRSGIPYLLLEQTVDAFERKANEILGPTNMSITVQTITATKKGEARDRLNVLFNDERGQLPLPKASGMQEQPLVMGIRTGLALVGCQFYGNTPELYMQDEGFGAFHDDLMDLAREMIDVIAEQFQTFIYITHKTELVGSADVQLKVAGVHGSSRVVGLPNGAEIDGQIEERKAS